MLTQTQKSHTHTHTHTHTARHQGTTCTKVVLYCHNKGCVSTFERGKEKEHYDTLCAYQPVPCVFAPHGCTFRPLRKEQALVCSCTHIHTYTHTRTHTTLLPSTPLFSPKKISHIHTHTHTHTHTHNKNSTKPRPPSSMPVLHPAK